MEHVAQRLRTRDLTAIAACAALMAVCAWIAIPTDPPFTLQTLAVFLAVGLLGGRRGTIAVGIYLLMGAVGLPVFAGFGGGLGILMGTTGGYIWGFLGSALVMWAMERILGTHLVILLLSMLLGLLVCYAFGTVWYVGQVRRPYQRGSGAGTVRRAVHSAGSMQALCRHGPVRPPAPPYPSQKFLSGIYAPCEAASAGGRHISRPLPCDWGI